MSLTIRELLDEEDFALLLDCLDRERIRSRSIENRPIQGYGGVGEQMKKDKWGKKADEIEDLQSRISEEYS
jgi:hypothetical protein